MDPLVNRLYFTAGHCNYLHYIIDFHRNSHRTSKISFQDAVSAIAKYAFVASFSPLILSLEIHCSHDQQETMANILINAFGESLVTCFVVNHLDSLPSPQILQGKVLIKGKFNHHDEMELEEKMSRNIYR